MATIYNSDLSKELREGGKLQVTDRMPSELAEKVVPVMEVNPKLLRRSDFVVTSNKTTSGSQSVYTVPVNRDFFITSLCFGFIKDVTCDAATGDITLAASIGGVSGIILRIPILTLTADSKTIVLNFPNGLKIDRGSTISIGTNPTYTAGLMSRSVSIFGYHVDNPNA